MGQPIMISMSDILLLAGAIVTISAAVKVVCEAIERIRKPNKTQDARIAELESKSEGLQPAQQAGRGKHRHPAGTAGAVGPRNRRQRHRSNAKGESRADRLPN